MALPLPQITWRQEVLPGDPALIRALAADSGFFRRFAVFDKTAGKRPPVRWIFASDQEHFAVNFNDDVNSRIWVFVTLYDISADGTDDFFFHGLKHLSSYRSL